MLYSELQCSDAIHKAVERMGFAEMTEIQEKTIPVMMAGYDVIAKAPTGTGKTCAFGIPVAEHILPENKYPQAVIMAPTRELAQQIAEELTAALAGIGVQAALDEPLPPAKHVFTHKIWELGGWKGTAPACALPDGYVWAAPEDLAEVYPVPNAFGAYVKAK